MRPMTNAMLCILCAAGSAAPAFAAQTSYYIKLEGVDPPGAAADDPKPAPNGAEANQLEISSFTWGANDADGPTGSVLLGSTAIVGAIALDMGDAATDRDDRTSGNDRTERDDSRGSGDDRADGNDSRANDGKADGPPQKRRQRRINYSRPLERGVVRVKVTTRWLACRIGTKYPVLTLGAGALLYELRDAIITSCRSTPPGRRPIEEVSFNYSKVTVRGWDPKKKEQ